jgi:hypothetical protein
VGGQGQARPAGWRYTEGVQPLQTLNAIGFERTRRAVAALALSLFVSLFLILAFILFLNGQAAWVPAFVGLAACYGVAFMGVAAEWFWGRWFADGLGWSGLMIAIASLVMTGGWNPVLGIYGGLHGLVVLMLAGRKMAERFDGQPGWRKRYGMDDFGVARLRKTVTRASASLPSVILWALGPKQAEDGLWLAGACLLGGGLVFVGLGAVVRLRTWGVFALAAAALIFLGAGGEGLARTLTGAGLQSLLHGSGAHALRALTSRVVLGTLATTPLSISLLLLAVAPFAGPAARFLARHPNE